jgi:hypothetical protein
MQKNGEKPAGTRLFGTGILFAFLWVGRNRAMTKKIEAIIREDALDAIKHSLQEIGIVGMNIVEIRGHGRERGHDAIMYPGDIDARRKK